jgi:acetyl-CoA acetyltransferase
MSDFDVFIITAVQHADPSEAIRQAVVKAEVDASRVQDVVFGLDAPHSIDVDKILGASTLACSAAAVTPSLHAVFFAAQSILSGDVDVAVALGMEADDSTAILLASPDAVGRWNLMPNARLAARSLTGVDPALRGAGIELKEVSITKGGKNGALLIRQTLEELEQQSARWGMVTEGELALLMERL